MGHDGEPYDDPKLKGLSRYFNGQTIRGRANVAMATFAGLILYVVYKKAGKYLPERKPKAAGECECVCPDPKV